MTRTLAALFAGKILRCIDRIVATLDGLDDTEAAWTPDAPAANSLAGIVNHVLANVEENVLVVIAGGSGERERTAEFTPASGIAVRERWSRLRPLIARGLDNIDDAALLSGCVHPRRGTITIGEMLIVIRGHVAEHEGQAALTRDLVLAHRQPQILRATQSRSAASVESNAISAQGISCG